MSKFSTAGKFLTDFAKAYSEQLATQESIRNEREEAEIAVARKLNPQFKVGDVVRIDWNAGNKGYIATHIGVVRKVSGSQVWVKPNGRFTEVIVVSDYEIEKV
jgi:ribosomal protein L21E